MEVETCSNLQASALRLSDSFELSGLQDAVGLETTGEAPVSATGFWTGFRTLFLGPTQRLFFPSRGPTSLRTFPTHWFPRLKQLLCVRESESRMYVAQLWPSACPCTLIVVPMRVLFPKKKENRNARFAKAATSSYLVDVSPTPSFARCVGLVGRLGLGRAHVRMDSSRLYSSSKPTSDSDLCSALSLKCLPRVASSLRGTAFV